MKLLGWFYSFLPPTHPPKKKNPLQIPSPNFKTTILFRKLIYSETNRIQGMCAWGRGKDPGGSDWFYQYKSLTVAASGGSSVPIPFKTHM